MPLDFGLLDQGPRINTPFENLSQILQVRQQQESARGLAEQRQAIAEQRRAQTDKIEQENADREATGEAIRQGGGVRDQTLAWALKSAPNNVQELTEFFDKADASAANIKKLRVQAKNDEADFFGDLAAGAMKNGGTPDALKTALAYAVEQFPDYAESAQKIGAQLADAQPEQVKGFLQQIISQAPSRREQNKPPADYNLGDSRMSGATNQPLATAAPKVPDAPKLGSFEDFVGRYAATRRLKPEQLSAGDITKAKAQYEAAGRAPTQPAQDNSPLETIIGPDGTPIRVRRQDAIGKAPASGTMKPASGVEKRALNFFNRAEQADGELEKLESEVQKMGLASQGRMSFAPNVMQSQTGQSYGAAQRAFTEARLRKDSGAAIPEGEFVNDRKTYFAQPGDSQQTLEQKRRARGAILASLGFESGQALGEFVGDADEAKSLVQKYKARATGTPAPAAAPASGGTVDMIAPDGRALKVPAADVQRMISLGAKKAGG